MAGGGGGVTGACVASAVGVIDPVQAGVLVTGP